MAGTNISGSSLFPMKNYKIESRNAYSPTPGLIFFTSYPACTT
jgi:hypothetical protein